VNDLIRKGLLGQAEARLGEALAPNASAGDRGWAELLSGNIAYERGDFVVARGHYGEAEALLTEAGQNAAAARQNLGLVEERLARSADLSGELSGLQAAVVLTMLVGVLVVGILAKRST
jgi:hypothetical protein